MYVTGNCQNTNEKLHFMYYPMTSKLTSNKSTPLVF